MNNIKIAAAALPLVLGACATPPNSIKPTNVSVSKYAGWSCARLDAEAIRVNSELAPILAKQQNASSNDAAGVFLIGVPLGSIGEKDTKARETTIAHQKGELQALQAARLSAGC